MGEKLRIGVAGLGAVVDEIYERLYYASAFTPQLEVVAIADRDEEKVKAFGDRHDIPVSLRFTDYNDMIRNAGSQFDAVSANLPDSVHRGVTIASLAAGKYVMVPKPPATTVEDAHAMIMAIGEHGGENGVFFETDFHKRLDKVFQQLKAAYQSGRYGDFVKCYLKMEDALKVAYNADPKQRFFSDPAFAAKNSPISFLTVHMADALMYVIGKKPATIVADASTGVLEGLDPENLTGALDTVQTRIYFKDGSSATIDTGWIYPNGADALTVQGGQFTGTEGVVGLDLTERGYTEYVGGRRNEINTGFKFLGPDGLWGGYGMESPGAIFNHFLAHMNGQLTVDQRAALIDPLVLGFYSTVVVAAAEESIRQGEKSNGFIRGASVTVDNFLVDRLGADSSRYVG